MPRLKSAPDFNWKLGHTMIRGSSDIFTLLQIHLSPFHSHNIYQQQNCPALTISSSSCDRGLSRSGDILSRNKASQGIYCPGTIYVLGRFVVGQNVPRPLQHKHPGAYLTQTNCTWHLLSLKHRLLIHISVDETQVVDPANIWADCTHQPFILTLIFTSKPVLHCARVDVQFCANCCTISRALFPTTSTTMPDHSLSNEILK